jgi:hypothetical protein
MCIKHKLLAECKPEIFKTENVNVLTIIEMEMSITTVRIRKIILLKMRNQFNLLTRSSLFNN